MQCPALREDGVAVIVALMAMTTMMALAAALALTTSSEALIAGNFRSTREAWYAADGIAELAAGDLRAIAEWHGVLDGTRRSGFVDGPPSGERMLPGGASIDLSQILNLANCQQTAPCGGDVPWRLFAHGALGDLLPAGAINSPFYVVALVRADPVEPGVLRLRGIAFGSRARMTIEVAMARADNGETRILSWRAPR
jgi:hypothetical protein